MEGDRNEADRILGEDWMMPGYRRYTRGVGEVIRSASSSTERRGEVGEDGAARWGAADKMSRAESYFASDDVGNTCATLAAFISQVTAQSGKSIPTTTAATLISDANEIRTTLNC